MGEKGAKEHIPQNSSFSLMSTLTGQLQLNAENNVMKKKKFYKRFLAWLYVILDNIAFMNTEIILSWVKLTGSYLQTP